MSYSYSDEGVCGVVAFESVGRAPFLKLGAVASPILAEEFHFKRVSMDCSDGTPPLSHSDSARQASSIHHRFINAAREGRFHDIPPNKQAFYSKFHVSPKEVHPNSFKEGTDLGAPAEPVHHESRGPLKAECVQKSDEVHYITNIYTNSYYAVSAGGSVYNGCTFGAAPLDVTDEKKSNKG